MNYKYSDFKQGQNCTFEYEGQKTNATILKDKHGNVRVLESGEEPWILLDKYEDYIEGNAGIENLKLLNRTIEDVKEGDLIKDEDGYFSRVLGRAGKLVFVSSYWKNGKPERSNYSCGYSVDELKEYGYTIVDETKEEKKETITIEGHTYDKKEVEKRLKDLEEV
jgi:hypothetical protein